MHQRYYAHGKLLLTAEYAVLDGAEALALPTQRGQSMYVSPNLESKWLYWESINYLGDTWLKGVWNPETCEWVEINNSNLAHYLQKLLTYAKINLGINLAGYNVKTYLEFPTEWGLGSSSSLISLLSQWWKTDAYTLLQNSFGGSGYDVACAEAGSPIIYQLRNRKPFFREVNFYPKFQKHLAFVYLEKKQNSREGIQAYRAIKKNKENWLSQISQITQQILDCEELKEFETLIARHENLTAQMLEQEKVQDLYFKDYSGVIKSLGAWGGDFILVTFEDSNQSQQYFSQKGYHTWISYQEMVVSK